MTDNQYNYAGLARILSVSGGNNADSGITTGQTLLSEDIEEILSVSGGDNMPAGDGNIQPNIYIISLPQETLSDAAGESLEEVVYTLWDKPLEEYSVSEGLLLIIATLAVAAFIWTVLKGGFSWLSW